MRHNVFSLSLFDARGQRKYLCAQERRRFLRVCAKADTGLKLLGQLLALTGCRISEALELTRLQLDIGTQRVVFRTLKRRKCTHRAVPVPSAFLRELVTFAEAGGDGTPIWKWCRQTAWREIKGLMTEADITGPQACPKGLRHAYGILAAQTHLAPGLTQRFMGHARLETTAIYQDAAGLEERQFASRLWRDYANP